MEELKKLQEMLSRVQTFVWIGFISLILMVLMGNCNGCSTKNDVHKILKENQVQIIEKDSIINTQTATIIELERELAAERAAKGAYQSSAKDMKEIAERNAQKPTNITVKTEHKE